MNVILGTDSNAAIPAHHLQLPDDRPCHVHELLLRIKTSKAHSRAIAGSQKAVARKTPSPKAGEAVKTSSFFAYIAQFEPDANTTLLQIWPTVQLRPSNILHDGEIR
ncbi:MAG: hypothetical protein M1820_003054 [Bogoriella megaspora]|nr:MAG: hypothetical protein M1820_003054 [Bogoriella megaspora]